jgi:thiamine-phosphate pyrophosphorylase
MPSINFRLYLVTDRHQTMGRPLLSVVGRAVRAGACAVQLRERDLPVRDLLVLAKEFQHEMSGAKLFINDRVDLALALDTHGVHLREGSLPTPAVRGLLGPRQLLGRSVHSLDGVASTERHGADFVVLGPIYETPSKQAYGPPLGLGVLEQAARTTRIPIFAIGGITAARAREVRGAGGFGVAVLSSILSATNVEKATEALCAAIEPAG